MFPVERQNADPGVLTPIATPNLREAIVGTQPFGAR
jgi:hypothetical protein